MSGAAPTETKIIYDQRAPKSPRASTNATSISPEKKPAVREAGQPVNFRKAGEDGAIFLSNQPENVREVEWMLVKAVTDYPGLPIMFVDSRQETHFYADDIAMSDYAGNNDVNMGLTTEEVEAKEAARIRELNEQSDHVLVVHKLEKKDGGVKLPQSPEEFIYEKVRSEREVVMEIAAKLGIDVVYRRLAWPDHQLPPDVLVDENINIAEDVIEHTMVTLAHCAGGNARSAMFYALMLAVKYQGEPVELDDSIANLKISSSALGLHRIESRVSEMGEPDAESRARLRDAVNTYLKDADSYKNGITFSVWNAKRLQHLKAAFKSAFGSSVTLFSLNDDDSPPSRPPSATPTSRPSTPRPPVI